MRADGSGPVEPLLKGIGLRSFDRTHPAILPDGSGVILTGLTIVLMSTPFAAEIGDTVRVLDPLAYAASLIVIVTSCLVATTVPIVRAARVDPIATLKQD